MIYLDTSAFIKLYLREEGSEDVQNLVVSQDDPLPVWDFLEAELTNALWLKVFRGELSKAEASEQVALFAGRKAQGFYYQPDLDRAALMEKFRELAQRTPESGCRTIDLFHLAAALLLEVSRFASYDGRQRDLAESLGLAVFPAP